MVALEVIFLETLQRSVQKIHSTSIKDYHRAKQITATSLYFCLLLSLLVTVFGIISLPDLLRIAGSSDNTFEYARSYLIIILSGSIFIMLNFTLGQLLGGAGAAIATVISNALGIVYYLVKIRGLSVLSVYYKNISLNRQLHDQIWKIGIPASLAMILMRLDNGIANKMAVTYGDVAVAGLGVDMRTMSVTMLLMLGLAIGSQPLIGYSYGGNNYKRLKDTIKTAASAIAVFFTVLFALFAEQTIKVFINDTNVIQIGIRILYALLISLPFVGVQMVFMLSLQAMGEALPSLIVSISRSGIFYIPITIVLNLLFGFSGFIYAQASADFCTTILAMLSFKSVMSKL
jgi:multidrug efflux pump